MSLNLIDYWRERTAILVKMLINKKYKAMNGDISYEQAKALAVCWVKNSTKVDISYLEKLTQDECHKVINLLHKNKQVAR